MSGTAKGLLSAGEGPHARDEPTWSAGDGQSPRSSSPPGGTRPRSSTSSGSGTSRCRCGSRSPSIVPRQVRRPRQRAPPVPEQAKINNALGKEPATLTRAQMPTLASVLRGCAITITRLGRPSNLRLLPVYEPMVKECAQFAKAAKCATTLAVSHGYGNVSKTATCMSTTMSTGASRWPQSTWRSSNFRTPQADIATYRIPSHSLRGLHRRGKVWPWPRSARAVQPLIRRPTDRRTARRPAWPTTGRGHQEYRQLRLPLHRQVRAGDGHYGEQVA